ncbi:unnamed protein product [Hymenolepis diminuta]|uniref:Uncharacterized protein n=1 Tax=Hymenolepis diminuta TaxID=6216 RepID=A0A564YF33_HYMDI|nr:unnamed protein product [Hymenolepis diminuta]
MKSFAKTFSHWSEMDKNIETVVQGFFKSQQAAKLPSNTILPPDPKLQFDCLPYTQILLDLFMGSHISLWSIRTQSGTKLLN